MNLIEAPVILTSKLSPGNICETRRFTLSVKTRISGVVRSAICTEIRALRPSAVAIELANPDSSFIPRGKYVSNHCCSERDGNSYRSGLPNMTPCFANFTKSTILPDRLNCGIVFKLSCNCSMRRSVLSRSTPPSRLVSMMMSNGMTPPTVRSKYLTSL